MDPSGDASDPGAALPMPSLIYEADTDGESTPFISLNILPRNQRGTINIPSTSNGTINNSNVLSTSSIYNGGVLVTSSQYRDPVVTEPVTNLSLADDNSMRHFSRPELDLVTNNPNTTYSRVTDEQLATQLSERNGENRMVTSEEEHSPYGSPGRKYEEIVANSEYNPTQGRYRDRRYTRKYTNDITTYQGRLNTFFDWVEKGNIVIDKESLARAGFYYEGCSDRVYCFDCGCELSQWTAGDDPEQEHRKNAGFSCINGEQ